MKTLNPDEQMPDFVVSAIAELRNHAGFHMVNHFFEKKRSDLVRRITNTEVGDQETHDLKQQLQVLEEVSPQIAADKMASKAGARLSDYKTIKP